MGRSRKQQMARIRAELESPLPPVDETLAMLDQLATHQYETKARTRAALKLAHRTLHNLLSHIHASARYPRLISSTTADALHRDLRRSLELDKPKRFPSLPRPRTRTPAPPTPEVTAADTVPSNAMSPDQAADLFGDEGIEFDRGAG